MINIIYGVKGSGKTKRIIDAANDRAHSTKGSLVYITDCADHSSEVDNSIRFIDIKHYGITDENGIRSGEVRQKARDRTRSGVRATRHSGYRVRRDFHAHGFRGRSSRLYAEIYLTVKSAASGGNAP